MLSIYSYYCNMSRICHRINFSKPTTVGQRKYMQVWNPTSTEPSVNSKKNSYRTAEHPVDLLVPLLPRENELTGSNGGFANAG